MEERRPMWCHTCGHWTGGQYGEECVRIVTMELQLGQARDALMRITYAETAAEMRAIANVVVEPIQDALREAVKTLSDERKTQ